jgi:chorismate synthase
MLNTLGINIRSGLCEVDGIGAGMYDFDFASSSPLLALDPTKAAAQEAAILAAREAHDSVGGVVLTMAENVPTGLGEPLYYKLDAILAEAMMGINAAKAVEVGDGVDAARLKGSQNNDPLTSEGFASNHSGGILGGISNGDPILVKTHFKPTPSIFQPQSTVNIDNEETTLELKGRHDPCVAVRGAVVTEAMMALVLGDMVLLNMGKRMDHLTKIYTDRLSTTGNQT